MIQIEQLRIYEFRGIRDLQLSPEGKNFAICGPNGTGKSGVVDAIEFALTGEISRLSGRGTGNLSVKSHGPHVDSRDKPANAVVEATAFVPSLNERFTIRRSVKDARTPAVTPLNPQISEVLNQVAQHPELVLSRRELIRYVLSEPGKRSEEVQALLRLSELDDLRTTFQKIANAAERDALSAKKARDQALEDLLRALGITKSHGQELLFAVNARRSVLGLEPLERLENTTSIRDGIDLSPESAATSGRIAKTQATSDIDAARKALMALATDDVTKALEETGVEIAAMAAEPAVENAANRETLLVSALELFDEVHCPVCDTEWDPAGFRQIVADKRKQLQAAISRRRVIEARLALVNERIETAASALNTASKYGPLFSSPIPVEEIRATSSALAADAAAIKRFLPLAETIAAHGRASVPIDIDALLVQLEAAIAGLPEPSARDAARDYLTIGQEKLAAYRTAGANRKRAQDKFVTARRVFDLFGQAVTSGLDGIYKAVESRFIELYRVVNHEDEGAFEAHLIPSFGKLGFDVDFYGRGFFPPGAYHSEGHQDAMGLCLYLALMDHLLGTDFTFAVLDDVLMSVDAGHRREVCRLLQSEFPHTQFFLTTHDDIWLRHMKSESLIGPKACVHFRKWDVQSGPTEWNDIDIWCELEKDLARNDIRSGAALLRHYLEHFAQETCHRLRARVEFRGDAQFTLGDTLPNAVAMLGTLLGKGRNAANSWKQDVVARLIEEREAAFTAAKIATNVDQWQINAAVHFNTWATLSKEDFVPVVAAYRDLVSCFACKDCEGLLYVLPERGEKEALRCSCGSINTNLNRKPTAA